MPLQPLHRPPLRPLKYTNKHTEKRGVEYLAVDLGLRQVDNVTRRGLPIASGHDFLVVAYRWASAVAAMAVDQIRIGGGVRVVIETAERASGECQQQQENMADHVLHSPATYKKEQRLCVLGGHVCLNVYVDDVHAHRLLQHLVQLLAAIQVEEGCPASYERVVDEDLAFPGGG